MLLGLQVDRLIDEQGIILVNITLAAFGVTYETVIFIEFPNKLFIAQIWLW